MTESPEARACRRYAELAAAVDAISSAIGFELDQCPLIQIRGQSVLGNNNHATHLRIAYSVLVDRGVPEGDHRAAHADEISTWLGGNWPNPDEALLSSPDFEPLSRFSSLTCLHCLVAHQLIQQRKALRIQFGAAKRAVRQVGKRIIRDSQTA